MSRELERRLAALERATSPERTRYVVSDRMPEEGGDDQRASPPMTEAEWVAAYGKAASHSANRATLIA
jgi:hypothetical protein